MIVLENAHRTSDSESINGFSQIIRGGQAKIPLSVGIVGGGKACYNLLQLLDEDRLSRLKMKILGISDRNPKAIGLRYAKELNLFTTTNLKELFSIEGLNLIIELTGSTKVREEIIKSKPSGISVIDHVAARLLWDLIQMEIEKTELEREHQRYQERNRQDTQVILDSLPYRIMVVNMDMTIDAVNQTFLSDLNLKREDIQGKHCYEARYGLHKPC